MEGEIFVSYSQPDYGCAMEMVTRVEAQGIDCWIAPRDIAPSTDWGAEIIDAIAKSRTMVLVLSASSNDSPQVRREVERAVHEQVNILSFRIENLLPSKSLEYFLSAQSWMDAFPPPREPHYTRLCAYLKAQLAAKAEAGQAPVDAQAAPSESRFTAPPAPRQPLDCAEVLRIERLLAGYIGPSAKHLVKAAASYALSLEELVRQVATQLETETDRHELTRRWRTGELAPGSEP